GIGERLPGGVAEADEAVIAAAADECQARSVRRPAEPALFAARLEELRRLLVSFQGDRPDLLLQDEGDAVSLRGHGGRVAFAQPPRRTARDRDDEDGLFG